MCIRDRRGRICLPNRPQYEALEEFVAQGASIKKTTLSDQFTIDDFKELYGEDYILLFYSTEERGLEVAHDNMRTLSPGTKIYAMIHKEKS